MNEGRAHDSVCVCVFVFDSLRYPLSRRVINLDGERETEGADGQEMGTKGKEESVPESKQEAVLGQNWKQGRKRGSEYAEAVTTAKGYTSFLFSPLLPLQSLLQLIVMIGVGVSCASLPLYPHPAKNTSAGCRCSNNAM